jgi:hypothetical protein
MRTYISISISDGKEMFCWGHELFDKTKMKYKNKVNELSWSIFLYLFRSVIKTFYGICEYYPKNDTYIFVEKVIEPFVKFAQYFDMVSSEFTVSSVESLDYCVETLMINLYKKSKTIIKIYQCLIKNEKLVDFNGAYIEITCQKLKEINDELNYQIDFETWKIKNKLKPNENDSDSDWETIDEENATNITEKETKVVSDDDDDYWETRMNIWDSVGESNPENIEDIKDNPKIEEDECCICMEYIDDIKVALRCEHFYCKKCINDWMKNTTNAMSRTCPTCRKPIEIISQIPVVKEDNVPLDQQTKIILSELYQHQYSSTPNYKTAKQYDTSCKYNRNKNKYIYNFSLGDSYNSFTQYTIGNNTLYIGHQQAEHKSIPYVDPNTKTKDKNTIHNKNSECIII